MTYPQIVSRDEWLAARAGLLIKEKEATRARDKLNAERRRLPMVKIEKEYVFKGPEGKASLLDLFDGRRQLIVYSKRAMHPRHSWRGCIALPLDKRLF
jgi:predicted dithiol-disulfide oxidoreductase (DUF899 family)